MQLRTFSAATSSEVLSLIKAELGGDAVILDTQEENGIITMTAALERSQNKVQPASVKVATAYQSVVDVVGGSMSSTPRHEMQAWQEEWGNIRNHLLALMKPALKLEQLAPRQRLAIEFLQREGVDDEGILHLFQGLQQDAAVSILVPLAATVGVQPWSVQHWQEQVQFIAGPFGSGKTSVAIRLALHLKKTAPDVRVCLINADATRGNGRLLLQHYCKLSDMAYKEAASTLELVARIESAKREGFERIIVDLPGLSRGKLLHDLLLDAGFSANNKNDVAVHLTLPPYYDPLQIRSLLSRYKTCFAGSIIWTKLDEVEHFGQIINIAMRTKLPVSALSFGAGLGSSLVPAEANMLWRLLFKKELPS